MAQRPDHKKRKMPSDTAALVRQVVGPPREIVQQDTMPLMSSEEVATFLETLIESEGMKTNEEMCKAMRVPYDVFLNTIHSGQFPGFWRKIERARASCNNSVGDTILGMIRRKLNTTDHELMSMEDLNTASKTVVNVLGCQMGIDRDLMTRDERKLRRAKRSIIRKVVARMVGQSAMRPTKRMNFSGSIMDHLCCRPPLHIQMSNRGKPWIPNRLKEIVDAAKRLA
jgi:hypothetical protein